MPDRVLVLDLVGLTPDLLRRPEAPTLRSLAEEGAAKAVDPPFPAVTCTAQAALTTGASPAEHGVVGNGWFDRQRHQTVFWEQSSALVEQPRTWDVLKAARPTAWTAALFLQQSLYAPGLDAVVSPRPLHTHDGLVPWVHSKPPGLAEGLEAELGRFPLHHYWGPAAGLPSTSWIAKAAARVLARQRPALAYLYLPHLDYDNLRHGPSSPEAREALAALDAEVAGLLEHLRRADALEGTAIVAVGEYAFRDVRRPVAINRVLREAGLLAVRTIGGHEYLDTELSEAFAVVDHQAAHVYLREPARWEKVAEALRAAPGVDRVLGPDEVRAAGLDHPRSGHLVAVARPDAWFAWPYWTREERAPPNARSVDIHGKPGFDPLELFLDAAPRHPRGEPGHGPGHGHGPGAGGHAHGPRIAGDLGLVRGSHGRPAEGPGDQVAVVVHGAEAPTLPGCRTLADVHRLVLDLLGAGAGDPGA